MPPIEEPKRTTGSLTHPSIKPVASAMWSLYLYGGVLLDLPVPPEVEGVDVPPLPQATG